MASCGGEMTGDKNLESVFFTVALTQQFSPKAVPKTQPNTYQKV